MAIVPSLRTPPRYVVAAAVWRIVPRLSISSSVPPKPGSDDSSLPLPSITVPRFVHAASPCISTLPVKVVVPPVSSRLAPARRVLPTLSVEPGAVTMSRLPAAVPDCQASVPATVSVPSPPKVVLLGALSVRSVAPACAPAGTDRAPCTVTPVSCAPSSGVSVCEIRRPLSRPEVDVVAP
jgi:hypothetical protein